MLDILVAAGVLYGLYRLTAPPSRSKKGGSEEEIAPPEAPEDGGIEGEETPEPPPYLGQECPYFGCRCAPRRGSGQCPALSAPCPYRGISAQSRASQNRPEEAGGASEEDSPTVNMASGDRPPEAPPPPHNPFEEEERSLAEEVKHLKGEDFPGSFDDVLPEEGDPYSPEPDEPDEEE